MNAKLQTLVNKITLILYQLCEVESTNIIVPVSQLRKKVQN